MSQTVVIALCFILSYPNYGNAANSFNFAEVQPSSPVENDGPSSIHSLYSMKDQTIIIKKLEDLPKQFRKDNLIGRQCGKNDAKESDNLRDPAELIVSSRGQSGSARHIFVIMPCRSGIIPNRSLFYLDLRLGRVSMIVMPSLNVHGAIEATVYPGYLEWHPENSNFTAILSNDILPHYTFRLHYKFSSSASGDVVLFLVERRIRGGAAGDNEDWSKIWEAPQWGSTSDSFPK